MSKSLNFLFVVPGYSGSVAIASRELIKHSNQIRGDILTGKDILANHNINLEQYDIILHYCWQDSDITGLLAKYADRTIVCITQGNAMDKDVFSIFQINCKTYKYVGCCNWPL